MKKTLLTILLTLTIFVSVFCYPVEAQSHPWNVQVTIKHNGKRFVYNMQNYLDKADAKVAYLGKNSKVALYKYLLTLPLTEEEVYNYVLPGFDDVLSFFTYVHREKRDAYVLFDKQGFRYFDGNDGISVNKKQLFEDILFANNGGEISLPTVADKAITTEQLKYCTTQRATFTTAFANSTEDRSHNIALATNAINGTVVGVGERFSFNQVVGKRTVDNGYKTAKVILDGAYVDGVGGGVCQVSTTLYNALLLADIVPNACQHTLISHYVLAGFDAMVSDSGADLTFVNDSGSPIYIQGIVQNKRVTFTIFGLPNQWHIERESVSQVTPFDTVEIVDKVKYPELVYTDQTLVVKGGSDGVKTQSYLKYYKDGNLVQTKLLRKNSYKKVDKVVARGYLMRSKQNFVFSNGSLAE